MARRTGRGRWAVREARRDLRPGERRSWRSAAGRPAGPAQRGWPRGGATAPRPGTWTRASRDVQHLGLGEHARPRGQEGDDVLRRADHHVAAPAEDRLVAREADDRVDRLDSSSPRTSSPTAIAAAAAVITGRLTTVAVLAQGAALDVDAARPGLAVDDEDAAGPDDDVVDVGLSTPRPAHVVEDPPLVRREGRRAPGRCPARPACRSRRSRHRAPARSALCRRVRARARADSPAICSPRSLAP